MTAPLVERERTGISVRLGPGSRPGRTRGHVSPGLLLAAPANVLIVLVIVVPFVYVIGLSFFDEASGTFLGLANYRALLNSTDFWPSLQVSLVWTASNLILQTLGGLGLALLLHRRFVGRDLARTLFLVPFVVPTAVVALMWQWILNSTFGVLNYVLLQVNLVRLPINFLGTAQFALPTLVLINAWRWIPLVGLINFAILQGIPRSEYEAARVEGAGAWSAFRHITLPYLQNSMTALGLLGTLLTFNIFDLIWLLTGGGPLGKTKSLPVYTYELGFALQNLGGAAAASVVLFLLLVLFTVLYFQRRELRSGR